MDSSNIMLTVQIVDTVTGAPIYRQVHKVNLIWNPGLDTHAVSDLLHSPVASVQLLCQVIRLRLFVNAQLHKPRGHITLNTLHSSEHAQALKRSMLPRYCSYLKLCVVSCLCVCVCVCVLQGCRGPVHAQFVENWVAYHYFDVSNHRWEMSVLELYNKAQGNVTITDLVLGKTSNTMSSFQPAPVEVGQLQAALLNCSAMLRDSYSGSFLHAGEMH